MQASDMSEKAHFYPREGSTVFWSPNNVPTRPRTYAERSDRAKQDIAKGAEIVVVPELPGCQFNRPADRPGVLDALQEGTPAHGVRLDQMYHEAGLSHAVLAAAMIRRSETSHGT